MPNGVSFDSFKAEWLAAVTEGNPPTLELGRRFAHKLVTQWLDVGETGDDLVYCDGSGDGGIDLAYLDRGQGADGEENAADGDTWYLVQSKYGSAFRSTPALLVEGQKVIDTLDGQRQRLSSLAEGLLERLTNFMRRASERDRIVLVFATEDPLTEEQKRAMLDLQAMGQHRLGTKFDVDSVSISIIYKRMMDEAAAVALERITLPIRGKLALSAGGLLIGSVFLLDLYEFLKAYRDRTDDLDQLYEKNVRRFLGSRGRVNKAILQTLKKEPERFGLYNNGITIVVTDFHQRDDGTVTLVEPYVVNGCQTTRTIWEVCRQRLEAGGTGTDVELEDWRNRASQGVVVTKIAKVGDSGEALLQAITRYTNTQNAVREKDFLALTSDFRTWAREMEERYGVFLEIQRGGWDSRRALQRQRPDIRQFTKAANAFDLLKVYGSGWLGEAGVAFGKNPPFLPKGTIFRRIMNDEGGGERFGVDDLYASYLLQGAADGFEFGRCAAEPSRRQTRFLFYMVVIELLRDVLNRSNLPTTHTGLSQALIELSTPEAADARNALMNTAIEVIDSYLTQGTELCVFDEPAYRNRFNYDLNAFLKWEELGRNDAECPKLRELLRLSKMGMGLPRGGVPPARQMIANAVTRRQR